MILFSVKFATLGDADGGSGIDTIQIDRDSTNAPNGPLFLDLHLAVGPYPASTISLFLTEFERLDVRTTHAADFVSGRGRFCGGICCRIRPHRVTRPNLSCCSIWRVLSTD